MIKMSIPKAAWAAWMILGIGVLVSVFASIQVKHNLERDAVGQFAFSCDQVTLKIHERLAAYALILRGGGALFAASEAVTRQKWRAYVENLRAKETVPGVQGIGFAQVIPPGHLAKHIASVRAEGFPEYIVRPVGERTTYTAIIYLEPFRDRNLRAFGFDMFSEPVRRAAMERARDTGDAALSGKVELVQETGKDVQAGTLMYVPVYLNGAPTSTIQEKRTALIGWSYSPYRMNDLMEGILAGMANYEGTIIDLAIYDGSNASPATRLFDSKSGQNSETHSVFHQSRNINFDGARWLLVFDRADGASSISYTPMWSALIGGFVLSGLLFGFMLSVINTRTNALRIAGELTKDVREKSEQLNTIFTLSPDGFVSFDAGRCVKYVSPSFTRMTNLKESEIIGFDEKIFDDRLAHICDAENGFPGMDVLRKLSVVFGHRNHPENPAGRHCVIGLSGPGNRLLEVGLQLSDSETVSQILYFRDITVEVEVDRMKSEFLSTAAHELRTPMSSIYGFAEVLLMQELDDETRRELLTIIYRQSEIMAKVINELLDIARIEARRGKDFIIEDVNVRVLLHEVVASFKTPASRAPPREPLLNNPIWVRADRVKLIQAVTNLLSNAYKYSPGGGDVSICFRTFENGGRVGIEVQDHGIGMTPEQQAHVCERFYRADTSGKILGTGLGMSIVKEIIELHGGELAIESQFGIGTTVTIWLPIDTPSLRRDLESSMQPIDYGLKRCGETTSAPIVE